MPAEVAAIFWCLKSPNHCTMILALETANRMVKAAGGFVLFGLAWLALRTR